MRNLVSILLLTLTSCATITLRKTYDVRFSSDLMKAKISINDSIYDLPATVRVKRSKDSLHFKLLTITSTLDYSIKSRVNPRFVFGNLFGGYFCPIGYLVDLTNQKRFYYGHTIHIDSRDSIHKLQPLFLSRLVNAKRYFLKKFPTEKGHLDLSVSHPFINNFYLQPTGEIKKYRTGFWGFSVGLDYYYSAFHFLNVRASTAASLSVPIASGIDDQEGAGSSFLSLTSNHSIGRLSFGYGIHYSKNYWWTDYEDVLPNRKSSNSLGVAFNLYHKFTRNFFVGLIYNPTVLKLDPVKKYEYEHLISFDIGYKIRLRR
jgi:hypothetical protein